MTHIDDIWSCFGCDYVGFCEHDEETDEECCPECGTHAGDGFGMIANDPRYRGVELLTEEGEVVR